uniref:Uncharacterized protein n=1 Tax=Salix viminalis TaxID=40686 RepID=A0A6N2KVK8_SALVM
MNSSSPLSSFEHFSAIRRRKKMKKKKKKNKQGNTGKNPSRLHHLPCCPGQSEQQMMSLVSH